MPAPAKHIINQKKILTKIKKQLLEEMKEKKEKEMFKVERRREIEMQKKGKLLRIFLFDFF